jgi:hypothetical protein
MRGSADSRRRENGSPYTRWSPSGELAMSISQYSRYDLEKTLHTQKKEEMKRKSENRERKNI